MADAVESGAYTPETIKRRMDMAVALLGERKTPIIHWAQGLEDLAKGALGGYQFRKAEQDEKAGKAGEYAALADALERNAGASPASPVPASAMYGSDFGGRADGMDRSITAGPRPPTAPPLAEAPPPTPSPYKLAGMAPQNSQDTFRTPLDVMAPRAQVAAALQGMPGAAPPPAPPPPMTGMTPAGATPVPTQAITPPVPPAGLPPQAAAQPPISAGPAPDSGRAKIAAMLRSPNPYVQQLGRQLALKEITHQPKYHKMDEDTLFEEGSGALKTVAPPRKSLIDPAERASYGIPADDKRPYQVGPNNRLINPPAETRLTVDQRGESAFQTHAATAQAKRFDELVKHGQDAKVLISDINNLREIGSRITTGKTAQITAALGPYAEAMGLKIDSLSDLQAYEAITARLAPRMRVPGTGATSDFEMRTFLQGLPNVANKPGGNEIISNTLESLEQHKIAASEIGSRALAGEISPKDAEKELRTLPDPFTLWKKFHKGQSPAAAPVGGDGWSVKRLD